MRYLLCLILSLALAAPCSAVQILRGSTVGGADYVPTTCYIYLNDHYDHYGMMAIYNSSGTRIIQSANTNLAGTGYPKWAPMTMVSPSALTPGQTYFIGQAQDGYSQQMGKPSPGYTCMDVTRGTWPDIPATISPGTDGSNSLGEPGMYCTNAAGQLLIGDSDTAEFTEIGGTNSGTSAIYYVNGYTCATF